MSIDSLNFTEDLEEHIVECKNGKYAGAEFDIMDLAVNYNMHLHHFTMTAVAYIVRYAKNGNKKDLLKAAHFIKALYEAKNE